jgi:hypothetical protein
MRNETSGKKLETSSCILYPSYSLFQHQPNDLANYIKSRSETIKNFLQHFRSFKYFYELKLTYINTYIRNLKFIR